MTRHLKKFFVKYNHNAETLKLEARVIIRAEFPKYTFCMIKVHHEWYKDVI